MAVHQCDSGKGNRFFAAVRSANVTGNGRAPGAGFADPRSITFPGQSQRFTRYAPVETTQDPHPNQV